MYDPDGVLVAEALAPLATRSNEFGHIEHDPEELLASLRRAIDDGCSKAVAAGHRVLAAGLATQRSSMVCWNRVTGEALSPVISWQDRRNAQWLKQLEPRAEWIRHHTGLVLTPHYGASKMRWCLDHLPRVRAAGGRRELAMGPLSSFVLFRLLIERPFVADPACASRTQLWNPAAHDWSPQLLELFGIDAGFLPRSVTSRYAYGTLDTPAGRVPLSVATGDQSAVPFAFGPLDPGTIYLNAGTGAFVQLALRDHLPSALRVLASVVWSDAVSVYYMLEGTVNGAGSALDWFAEREGLPLNATLASVDAHSDRLEPPLFLNGVSGLGSPFWVSSFESRFIGEGSREERLVAVLESIVFLIRVNVDAVNPHCVPLRRVVLTGGLSANERFCRAVASLVGLPVFRSREHEATARGLACLLAGQPPKWATSAAGDTIEPKIDEGLTRRFAAWRAAMEAALAAGKSG